MEENEVYPWTHLNFQVKNDGNPNHFQFAVWADTHYSHHNNYGVAEVRACVAAMERDKPEFVIIAGDCIEGNFQDGNFQTLWPGRAVPNETKGENFVSMAEEKRLLNSEWDDLDYLTSRMVSPVFYCTGNHELTFQNQYVGFPSPPNGKDFSVEVWEQRYGRQYYHFFHRGVLFLIANTEDPPSRGGARMSQEQVNYFKDVLAAYPLQPDRLRWTILIQHRPPNDSESQTIQELLKADRPGEYTVFHGHVHCWKKSDDGSVYSIPAAYEGNVAIVTMPDTGPPTVEPINTLGRVPRECPK